MPGSRFLAALLLASPLAAQAAPPVVPAARETEPLHQYEDAPATPDADDPAIYVDARHPERSFFVGTLKDGGLVVYDLRGRQLQAMLPPNAPAVTAADPATPAGLNGAALACPDSERGETFGRYNNVDVVRGVRLGGMRRDLAVVTDRGCDRLRVFAIVPGRAGGPLVDVTDPAAGRVFPRRFVTVSPYQPGALPAGAQENPLDDQNTAYGIGLWDDGAKVHAFVSQRSRGSVAELVLEARPGGTVGYRPVREYRFPAAFSLPARDGTRVLWTPCREDPDDSPQSEGIVVDRVTRKLYVAFEPLGVFELDLRGRLPAVVNVSPGALLERTRTFGVGYRAVEDDGEFSCEYDPQGPAPAGAITVPGAPGLAGANLEADVEGLAIYSDGWLGGYLLVSSQGDDTIHVLNRVGLPGRRYVGVFSIAGTGDTDGIDVLAGSGAPGFPGGLLLVHNGEAPPPASEEPVNGYEYDGSTRYELVRWADVAAAFDPPLRVAE